MTSRERVLAALRREEVDYVPCSATFNPLQPVLRRGHRWNFPWLDSASPEEQLAYQVERLGLDQVVSLGIDLCRPAAGVESKVWLDGDILHKVYTTPAGDLHASVRYNDLWPHGKEIPFHSDFNIGHFVEPWLQTEADLTCLKQIRGLCDTKDVLEKVRADFAAVKILADLWTRTWTMNTRSTFVQSRCLATWA
jgi:hypothetical protein